MSDPAVALAPLVRKLSLHIQLDEKDRAALLALPHSTRIVENGQYVVREGDVPIHSCLVTSGFALRHKIVGNGGRQIVNIHMTGDMVDLQNALLGVADHNVQALSRMEGTFIPRDALAQIGLARPTVAKALWLETLIEGSISREWIANVGRRDAMMRTAHLLCEFAYRLDAVGIGTQCDYELPMTQEQLADTLGLTAVHVNRTLKALDATGVITRRKRAVAINDLQKLAKIGDFRATYLHLPQRALPPHHQHGALSELPLAS